MTTHGTASFSVGFVLGAAIGAGLALILAPARGQETRIRLREEGIELVGRGKEVAEKAVDQFSAAATGNLARLSSQAQRAKEALLRRKPSEAESAQAVGDLASGEGEQAN